MADREELNEKISTLRKRGARDRRLLSVLGAIVALAAAASLILPALSLTPDAATPSAGFFLSADNSLNGSNAQVQLVSQAATATPSGTITVEGGSTNVTVNGSLSGTDMTTLGYNLYAYLLASNDGKAYGAKMTFENGNATATIPNVPANTYRFYLVYARDNRQLQVPEWNYNNVLDGNVSNWVDADGGYIFGFNAKLPASTTVSPGNAVISFELDLPEISNASITAESIMDRAVNYGITAESVDYRVQAYANFATKALDITNANTGASFGNRAGERAEGEAIPNLLASIAYDGQKLKTNDLPADYYVADDDKGKINEDASGNTAIVRNADEIADRVEIMISNTLKQAETLTAYSMATLPQGTSMDVSAYPDDATIILDATAISGEKNGYTIVKRPGQTIVFNMRGENVAPPQNIKVKLVDKNAQQVDVNGNPSTKIYNAGDEMRNAQADEGNVWNKLIWNFPDATSVTATNCIGGVFLAPKGDFTVSNKGGGWIVARGKVSVTNEWYGFPGTDTPFVTKKVRKTFVGLDGVNEVNPDYELRLATHTNESTSGTTQGKPVTTFVLKSENDPSLVKDPSGAADQTGYESAGTDAEGNVFFEWTTPYLAIGNEHVLTEANAQSVSGTDVELVEFTGPYSGWNEASQNYEWTIRTSDYEDEASFRGVFNVRSRDVDGYGNVYVTNHYNVSPDPKALSVTKTVEDPESIAPAGQQYTFEVTLLDGDTGQPIDDGDVAYSLNGEGSYTATCVDGVLTLTLKAGETAKLIGLPYGTRYTVREANVPAKCLVSYDGVSSSGGATGRLLADRSVAVNNVFSDDPGIPIVAHKDLAGGVLEDGEFAFRLVDQTGKLVKQVTNDANGVVSFGTLAFDADGTFDYKLYEVADVAKADIVFDPAEYTVRIVVEGGRARQVSYFAESGETLGATPMFRNKKLPGNSDTLTARKIFIDEDTGKAIRLSGGEFSFTAVEQVAEGSDATLLTFTGVNDADGMVTFRDASGNEFNREDLTQPATFVISEDADSYTGTLVAGQTLTYDDSTHQAQVTVDTKTVSRNPWKAEIVGNGDSVNLTLTLTPRDKSGTTYYLKPQYDPDYSEIREDGTVTFTVPVGKNLVAQDNNWRDYTFEYGIGDNYYWSEGHRKVGEVTIRARAGAWNQEPVEVSRVWVDDVELASSSASEKTVTLTYPEGSYPVFVNKVSTPKPDTADFTFNKVWVDNVSYGNLAFWPAGTEIKLKLHGAFKPSDGDADGAGGSSAPDGSTSQADYEFTVRGVAAEGASGAGNVAFEFVQPEGEGAPTIALAMSGSSASAVGAGSSGASGSSDDGDSARGTASAEGTGSAGDVGSTGNAGAAVSTGAASGHYRFQITGLPNTVGPNGEAGTWTYTLTEEAPSGFAASYGTWDADAGVAVPNAQIERTGISDGGYLINARIMSALPATGGIGTVPFIVGGIALIALAAFLLLRGRRK